MGLLERSEELAVLVERLASTESSGQLVLISGEAGAGKSALVREFLDRHGKRCRVLVGRCDDLFAPRPLGPFHDIGRDSAPQLAGAIESGDPTAVFDALLAELAPAKERVVLVLEDLQWADEATLDLLRFVARRLDHLGCLVLATHRDDLAPSHPLRRAWGSLVGPGVARVHLAPLSLAAVEQLAASSRIDAATLHARTGGNPFFVTELLVGDATEIPASVRDTILARAAQLSGSARDALDAAAVLGRHATTALVTIAGDCSTQAIDECVAVGLLVDDDGRHRFRHDLSRDTIEAAMTPLRRRQIHRRALDALGDDDDIVQRAHHAIGATDPSAIAELARRAGDHCVALGAHIQAAALYAAACQHAEHLDGETRLRLLQAHAETCLRVERITDAIASGEQVLRWLETSDDDLRLGRWEVWMADALHASGDGNRASTMLERGVQRLERHGESEPLADALALQAGFELVCGRFEDCIATGRRAEAMAERLELEPAAAQAMHRYGAALAIVGDPEGIPVLHAAVDRAKRGGFLRDYCVAASNLAAQYFGRRRLDVAVELLSGAIAVAEEHEMRLRRNCLVASRAEVRLMQGRWDDASADLGQVLAQPDLAVNNSAYALAMVGRLRALRGDPEARDVLLQSLEGALGLGEAQFVQYARSGLAEQAWLAGDAATARREAEALVSLAALLDPANLWMVALWARRTGVAWEPPADAPEPVAAILAGDHRAVASYWAGHGCPYEAADALGDSDDVDDLRSALAQLEALGARPRAKMVARRLRELGVHDLPRGPRASTRANAAGLTRREVEVAALVAGGLANAEIAARLYLSAKTVDHHVSSILTKLAVKNRRQVAAAATDAGVDLSGAREAPAAR